MKHWIQIYSGQEVDGEFDYEHPERFTWPVVSIAHHLSMICRYTGACRRFYSVAEHCARVALYAADLVRAYGTSYGDGTLLTAAELSDKAKMAARGGLVHDATEMVYGDVNSPLKNMPFMHGYKLAEAAAHPLVAKRFGIHKVFISIGEDKWDVVGAADLQALEFERVELLGKPPRPWFQAYLPPVVESNAFKGALGYPWEMAESNYLHLANILDVR